VKHLKWHAILAALVLSAAGQSHAAPPSQHPAYLHALRDLRLARTAIEARGGGAAMRPHEIAAIQHIGEAGAEVDKIAPDENKNVDAAIAADADPSNKIGGLHDAKAYLERALSDLKEAESDRAVRGDRQQAVADVSAALNSVNAGIAAYQDAK